MNIDINKVKIIVTIPLKNVNEVRNAILEAGAGVIGNYTHCSIATKCIGTFKPNDESNPYIGEINNLEFVEYELIIMFKKKYQIEVNEKEYNIIINTLNEYRNKQLLKGNIVDYLDKILFKFKRKY